MLRAVANKPENRDQIHSISDMTELLEECLYKEEYEKVYFQIIRK